MQPTSERRQNVGDILMANATNTLGNIVQGANPGEELLNGMNNAAHGIVETTMRNSKYNDLAHSGIEFANSMFGTMGKDKGQQQFNDMTPPPETNGEIPNPSPNVPLDRKTKMKNVFSNLWNKFKEHVAPSLIRTFVPEKYQELTHMVTQILPDAKIRTQNAPVKKKFWQRDNMQMAGGSGYNGVSPMIAGNNPSTWQPRGQ